MLHNPHAHNCCCMAVVVVLAGQWWLLWTQSRTQKLVLTAVTRPGTALKVDIILRWFYHSQAGQHYITHNDRLNE